MRFFTLILLIFSSQSLFAQATDLFFSEYVEGSGNVKYLEIFNGTGQTVSLLDYEVLLFSNGSSTQSDNSLTNLTGTLANGSVLVIANSNAEVVYNGDKILSNVTFFNGDDALAIRKKSTNSYVDIFGKIGEDPGSVWSANGLVTGEKTLIRKADVMSGVTVNPSSGFPTLGTEWIMIDQNDISDLGKHEFNAIQQPEGTTEIALDSTFVFAETIHVIDFTTGLTNLENGLEILRFVIHEDGFDNNGEDDLPTILTQLSFSFSGFVENVDSLALFAGQNPVSISKMDNSNSLNFPLDNYTIADNSSDTLTLKVIFKEKVTDKSSLRVNLNSAQVAENSS